MQGSQQEQISSPAAPGAARQMICKWLLSLILRYGDGAGNTVEKNSSVFSLIRMR